MPNVASVVNLASGDSAVSPGSLAIIFGSNLTFQQADTVPLSVTVGSYPAAVLTKTPQQLTVEIPAEAFPGQTTIQLASGSNTSAAFPISLQAYAPGIFTTTGNLGSIWHSDGTPVTPKSPANPGESLTLLATGLGPTNPAVPTGSPAPIAPQASARTQPTITIGSESASVQAAVLEPQSIAQFRVFFSVPKALSAGAYPLTLITAGQKSNTVTLSVTGLGMPTIDSLLNAASFQSNGIASPGSMATIQGLNFGTVDNLSAFPQSSFDGVRVTFNDIPAPLFAVVPSANQMNVLVPAELPSIGNVVVKIDTGAGSSAGFSLQMTPSAPGVFRIPDPSGVINSNGSVLIANTAWLAVPDSLSNSLHIPTNCQSSGISLASICGQPARAGDILTIFATGLGKATVNGLPGGAVLPTGSVAPASGNPVYQTVDVPHVTIGKIPAEVLFSGIAPGYAGFNQVNVRVPSGVPIGDQVQLQITTLNGLSDTVTIAIR